MAAAATDQKSCRRTGYCCHSSKAQARGMDVQSVEFPTAECRRFEAGRRRTFRDAQDRIRADFPRLATRRDGWRGARSRARVWHQRPQRT